MAQKLSTRKRRSTFEKKPTQCQVIYDTLCEAMLSGDTEWVNGRYFNDTKKFSQYHTRIWELQQELRLKGADIEASQVVDKYGFKSYRLVKK